MKNNILILIFMCFMSKGYSQCLTVYPALSDENTVVLISIVENSQIPNLDLIISTGPHAEQDYPAQPTVLIDLGTYSIIEITVDVTCEPNFTITNQFGQECTYINGVLCEDCPPINQWDNLINCPHIPAACSEHLFEFLFDNQNDILGTSFPNNQSQWQKSNGAVGHLYSLSPVVIGATKPAPINPTTQGAGVYSLTVKEGIISDKMSVSETAWADHVFKKDYDLMPIPTLKSYLKENKKLKHFPSQEEISQQGYDLYKIKKLQQLSIEELFLYIIELEKVLVGLETNYPVSSSANRN